MNTIQFKDKSIVVTRNTKTLNFVRGYKTLGFPFVFCDTISQLQNHISENVCYVYVPSQVRSAKSIDDLVIRFLKSKNSKIYFYIDNFNNPPSMIDYNHKDLTVVPKFNCLSWENGACIDEGGWGLKIIRAKDFLYDDLSHAISYEIHAICGFIYQNEYWFLVCGEL